MTLIAIHLIQNHAPSNLNRDDNGDPKDTLFGTSRRARISSQAIKRSMRWNEEFRSAFEDSLLATRTQLLPEWIRDELKLQSASDEELQVILQHAVRFGKSDAKSGGDTSGASDDDSGAKKKKKGGKGADEGAADEVLKTAQLMFLSMEEIQQLTTWLLEKCRNVGTPAFGALKTDDLVKEIKKTIGLFEPHAVDIAMFGRMTTSSPFKDVEAAVQVAHAFSTHKIETEYDFFTAVDDRSGESGAGMLGNVAFNSATYYKYINIHWEELLKNLRGDYELAAVAVVALLHAALKAIPSGKQNTFAAHNLPDFALVEVLAKNTPVSYANAFVQSMQATAKESLLEVSINTLLNYASKIGQKYEIASERAFFSIQDNTQSAIQECATISDLSQWLRKRIHAHQEA